MNNEAYDRGYSSYIEGICFTENPYIVSSPEFLFWTQGYEDASFDEIVGVLNEKEKNA